MQLSRKRPFDETSFDKHRKIVEANEKLNFQILHIKLDEGVGDDFQIIISTNPTLLKAITVVNQTLEEYTLRFWKNIFRPKYIDLVQSVQSCNVYRYGATSAKHSVANTSMVAW